MNKLSLFLISILCFLFSVSVQAATPRIYFEIFPKEVNVGSELEARIFVDSDLKLNAYALTFEYPEDALGLIRVIKDRSIIDVWKESGGQAGGGRITLEGGALTAFEGERGEVAAVRFRALKTGSYELRIGTAFVYAADGRGTQITPPASSFSLRVGSGTPEAYFAETSDRTPPEIKIASIVRDPFDPKQKLLGFAVSDRESGVKEVTVRAYSWFFWSSRTALASPVALPAGVWLVDMKVLDYAGNVEKKKLYDWSAFGLESFTLLAAVLVLLAVINKRIRRNRRYIIV